MTVAFNVRVAAALLSLAGSACGRLGFELHDAEASTQGGQPDTDSDGGLDSPSSDAGDPQDAGTKGRGQRGADDPCASIRYSESWSQSFEDDGQRRDTQQRLDGARARCEDALRRFR